ncbi:MAG: PEP-CTERM sorting domain-containing protein, partial [Phycisphaerae bacterium]|nr:PEP-CTERM sorting domain-containing protein [Phycisphaerae bacterium]
VSDYLYLGYFSGSSGTYAISGGMLSTADFHVGRDGSGTLNISSPSPTITVSNLLSFGSDSTFTAVAGATIHMTGSAFENENTDATDLAGLANLTLIFEGGAEDVDSFEVAGEDLGKNVSGWTDNFVLGTLQVGGTAEGKIQLVDAFDNQTGWVGDEALYVDTLILNEGAQIDFNGLNLYYLNGGDPKKLAYGDTDLDGDVDGTDLATLGLNWDPAGNNSNAWATADFDGDGDVDGVDLASVGLNWAPQGIGPMTQTPEPGTVALMAAGLAGVLAGRKKKKLQR